MLPVYRRRVLLFVLTVLVIAVTWDSMLGPEPRYVGSRRAYSDPENPPSVRRPGTLRVLFIGNSFTHYFGGQARIVTRLATSAIQPSMRPPIMEQATEGGATLRWHWELGRARQRIADGNWDYVVLQGHSLGPLEEPADFIEYAKRFNAEIKRAGARTVLFMTWPRVDEPQNGPKIAEAYEALGRELGADIVPVGRAFALAQSRRPQESLYEPDLKHPTAAGSYLAGCCFYRYFYHRDPTGLSATVVDETGRQWIDLGRDEATFLQSIAAEAVQPNDNVTEREP